MKISNIIIEIAPWYRPHNIELRCSMIVDGKEINWREIFSDSDFEVRAEDYLDYMKRKIVPYNIDKHYITEGTKTLFLNRRSFYIRIYRFSKNIGIFAI